MTWLAEILALIRAYPTELAVVGAVGTFAWPAWQFFAVRRQEARSRDFENFHRLVKELVQPEIEKMYLERQIAVVYELRHFHRYRDVTVRILLNLRKYWAPNEGYKALIEEIDLTVEYLRAKK